ncbi:MAG: SoxR reducing system RseC family protein [Gammaproteobacteria bacterium]
MMNEGAESIVHQARVVAVDDQSAWLEAPRTTACGGCEADGACGVSALSQILKVPNARLRVDRHAAGEAQPLRVGEAVSLRIAESTLRNAAVWAYLLPLMFLIAGASLGQLIFQTDLAAFIGALAGPMAALPLLRRSGSRINQRVQVSRTSSLAVKFETVARPSATADSL